MCRWYPRTHDPSGRRALGPPDLGYYANNGGNTRDISDTRERLVRLKRSLNTHIHTTKTGNAEGGQKERRESRAPAEGRALAPSVRREVNAKARVQRALLT